MKKIIQNKADVAVIDISDIDDYRPTFAKKGGEFVGMIIKEEGKGWILKLGGDKGATGHHNTLQKCISSAFYFDYEFYQ